ncbi:MAG: DUF3891 family protein [Anaerolineae bacterium]|nr:DUF3891 family protein [Anaerolineae bacterium]
MIVNSLKEGWEVVYQRSHANLAAILVAAWRQQDHVPRWTELVIATAQHDDQEMFWDEATHLTDIGAPLDFAEAPLDTSRLNAERVIANAYRQGLWIALLISRHNSFLYEPLRGQDARLDAFLEAQKRNQTAWRQQLGYSAETLEAAYVFLRWADRLSLILCRRELPERERELDVAPGPDGQMVRVMARADGTITLRPWVLAADELRVSVEVRRLRQLQFQSEAAFQQALGEAELEARAWCFKR